MKLRKKNKEKLEIGELLTSTLHSRLRFRAFDKPCHTLK